MTEIRSEMNALNSVPSLSKSGPLSSNHPQVVQLSSIHHPPADSLPYTQSSPRNLSNNNKNLLLLMVIIFKTNTPTNIKLSSLVIHCSTE